MNLFVLFVVLASDTTAQISASAFITSVSGDARVVRWLDLQTIPAGVDIGLFKGDSLKTGKDGTATIVYRGGKILSISNGGAIEIADPPMDSTVRGSPESEAVVMQSGRSAQSVYFGGSDGEAGAGASALFEFSASGERIALIAGVRGPEDTTNIVVYEPGNTALASERPAIYWSKHPAADSYLVVCQKSGMPLWRTATADTGLPYPAAQAGLIPGSYLLKVIIIKGADTLNTAERFFKVLKPEKLALIDEALNSVRVQNPDPFTLHFLSAKIFEQEYMIQSAIREYEEMLKISPGAAFIHAVLSDLYNRYGLPRTGNLHNDRYRELTSQK